MLIPEPAKQASFIASMGFPSAPNNFYACFRFIYSSANYSCLPNYASEHNTILLLCSKRLLLDLVGNAVETSALAFAHAVGTSFDSCHRRLIALGFHRRLIGIGMENVFHPSRQTGEETGVSQFGNLLGHALHRLTLDEFEVQICTLVLIEEAFHATRDQSILCLLPRQMTQRHLTEAIARCFQIDLAVVHHQKRLDRVFHARVLIP